MPPACPAGPPRHTRGMDQAREDYADPRPPRWTPTERQEVWIAVVVGLAGPAMLALIWLGFYFGRQLLP